MMQQQQHDAVAAHHSALLHRDLNSFPASVTSAAGSYLTLNGSHRVLDASGGAAVSCIGHANARVKDAISAQLMQVDYCHSMFFTCRPSENLAQLLVASTGGRMSRAYFVSSGSEAMDAALKLARQYFMELKPPQPDRIHFVSRMGSYHGNTIGALGVSGHLARRGFYEPILPQHCTRVSACNSYRSRGRDSDAQYVAKLAAELEAEFQRIGPHRVCAFIAEPIVGAALGCVPAVEGYFTTIKEVCDRHGVLLILDEVMCGMGRTGNMHAWETEKVVPDIQTIGKGLGGGYVPIAGLLVGHRVIDVLQSGTGCFLHGQTYQSHALVCAAALEVQRIIGDERLLENCKARGHDLESSLRAALTHHSHVGDIRGRGLFWAVEFVRDKATGEPFAADQKIATRVHEAALSLQSGGLMVYPGTGSFDGVSGDHVIVAPPFNITKTEVLSIGYSLLQALDRVLDKVQARY